MSSYVRCDGEGEKVVLAFPYDAAMVGEAKAIGGRYFDWNTKTNVFPFARLPQVVALADTHGIGVAQEVRALVPAAARIARPETGDKSWAGDKGCCSPVPGPRLAALARMGGHAQWRVPLSARSWLCTTRQAPPRRARRAWAA